MLRTTRNSTANRSEAFPLAIWTTGSKPKSSNVSMMMNQMPAPQKAQDKKNLILEILSVLSIFIPFLDDIAPAALAAPRIGAMIGDDGSLAVTIQDVVSDPGSAPLAILRVLGGTGTTLADVGNMAKLASARRGIPEDKITGIGPTFKTLDDELKGIEKPACRI